MNIFDDIRDKVQQAKNLQMAVDSSTLEMVKLVSGRLRSAYEHGRPGGGERVALDKLKRELRNWNLTTGTWK